MYKFKQLKDGSVSVYKNGYWQCFIEAKDGKTGMERALSIFEPEKKDSKLSA